MTVETLRLSRSGGASYALDFASNAASTLKLSPDEAALYAQGEFPATINVNGVPFTIERVDGTVYLTHPQWSLMGEGQTIEAARAQLLAEARELAAAMAHDPSHTLSPPAQRMRQFAANVR